MDSKTDNKNDFYPSDIDDFINGESSNEVSSVVSGRKLTEEDKTYWPIEYGVEDEDDINNEGAEMEAYIDYNGNKIFLNQVMRLDTPIVIDGIEFHGYSTISNFGGYLVHLDDSGDSAIVIDSSDDYGEYEQPGIEEEPELSKEEAAEQDIQRWIELNK